MTDDSFRRLDALLQIALRLARSASSGRIALAQVAEAIDLRWVPMPWGESIVPELEAALADSLEPLPFSRVERILRDAWEVKPTDELDELTEEPVLVTPTAQVHRASLAGDPVAIKVLRPGLASTVRQDLTLLESLAGPLRSAFPAVDAPALIREAKERVLDELDLETEGYALRRFHRALRDHPLFVVPAPIRRLSHDTVLVTEWIDGAPLAQSPHRDAAAAKLVIFSLGAARWGIAHCNTDPREVLVLPDGRIAITDLNSTRTVDPGRLQIGAQLVEAFVAEDLDEFASALEALGLLPAELAETAFDLVRHTLGEFATDASLLLDSDAVIAVRDRLFAQTDQLTAILGRGSLEPDDLWPTRGLGQLFSTIARVGATAPWRELVRTGLGQGWDARPDS